MSFRQYQNEKLKEMPEEVRNQAVEFLKTLFDQETVKEITEAYKEDPEEWWVGHHFFWGMAVRNALRTKAGLSDDLLPDKNWDDYYVPCVELALGFYTMEDLLEV